MFRPNNYGYWTRRAEYNKFGEPVWRAPIKVPVAVINLTPTIARQPEGAERYARDVATYEVNLQNSTVLIAAGYPVRIGDKLKIDGLELRITAVQANNNVITGKVDHYEVTVDAWQIDET